jgi:two-component system sensor histidine kinase CiaH
MRRSLKRYAAWATDSLSIHKILLQTRIRLAFFYLALGMFLLFSFSVLLVLSFYLALEPHLDNTFLDASTQLRFLDSLVYLLEERIVLLNILFILIIAGFAYFLSGMTFRPIKKSLDAQRGFTANASHQLRTPLAIMKSELQIALLAPTPHPHQDVLVSCLEEVDSMSRMVDDLLRLSRISTDQEPFRFRRVNVSNICTLLTKKMTRYAQEKDIEIYSHIAPDCYVVGDQERLEDAILNILRNAIDYSPANRSVQVILRKSEEEVSLSIKDQGIGISPQELTRVFERFYRGKNSPKQAKGSGLGLPIAQWIISKHRGKITLRSTENEGTQVQITLPCN